MKHKTEKIICIVLAGLIILTLIAGWRITTESEQSYPESTITVNGREYQPRTAQRKADNNSKN